MFVQKVTKKRRQGVLIEKILIKRRVCRGENVSQVTAQEETALKARGYNEDLLPSSPKQRTMGARNFYIMDGFDS